MKKFLLLTSSAALSALFAAPASATSCSAHYRACINHETSMGKSASKRCAPSLKKCLAACKAGGLRHSLAPAVAGPFLPRSVIKKLTRTDLRLLIGVKIYCFEFIIRIMVVSILDARPMARRAKIFLAAWRWCHVR